MKSNYRKYPDDINEQEYPIEFELFALCKRSKKKN